MRFKRADRIEEREITSRRLAASKRALHRQAAKLPLLEELISEQQPTPVERIHMIDAGVNRAWQLFRDKRAKDWKLCRQQIKRLYIDAQKDLMDKWAICQWPGDPIYLLSFIKRYKDCGFVYLDKPTEVILFDREKLALTVDRLLNKAAERKNCGPKPGTKVIVVETKGFLLKTQE